MKKLNFLFVIFVFFTFQAQTISGVVLSKEDHQPIPYAKIGIVDGNFGTQADENGKFQIQLDAISKDKELMVAVPGYKQFRTTVGDFVKENPHPIYLYEKVTNIQEVVLVPNQYKDKNLGVNTKSKSVMFTPNMEKGNSVVEETAVEFSSSKKLKLSKININFSRFEATTPIKVRYTIYDEKDGKPNNLLLNKDIIATITRDQLQDSTFSVDISNEKIWLQGKFFVGIQFIGQSDGKVALSGALFRPGYYRSFYGNWEKIGIAAPAINIDVKVKK
ncbi:carboxypeptidase-like regulatory domain-containing protein [Kaistella montana]|uniref:Carboxypeptidase-like regulatory domain-containing protein n=1 Tax=Kaistella montana TaxID=1849733 RepID=A0ABW5KAR3_9FLAO|nr:carboxypeptidase-like regulatory domain-containing protein [Kaistella montana]MCQ4035487.1 carboxypeptidase-like regulatory domain-containing protein [Kaistella montana]